MMKRMVFLSMLAVLGLCLSADALEPSGYGDSATGSLDTAPPAFGALEALPAQASEGEIVTLSFTASETLLSVPDVMVNEHPASYASDDGGGGYAFEYEVQASDPLGAASLYIGGRDLVGNPGELTDSSALEITGDTALPVLWWPMIIALLLVGAAVLALRRHKALALLILLLLAAPVAVAQAPAVANVTFVQQPSLSGGTEVLITYDLDSPGASSGIDVSLSKDGGSDGFPFPVTSVTGDLNGVTTGTGKQIVWDIAADYPGEDIPIARLRVTAQLNAAPVAFNDVAWCDEDTSVDVNLLDNDSDVDGDTLAVTNVTDPPNGSASINPDQTVTYTPGVNFNGEDSFTYTISDGYGGTATAVTWITVYPINDDAPVAGDDDVTLVEDQGTASSTPGIQSIFEIMHADLFVNDDDPDSGDSLSIVSVQNSSHAETGGGWRFYYIHRSTDHLRLYTPWDFDGVWTFDYTVEDSSGLQSTATVTVTFTPVNDDPPVAVADTFVLDLETASELELTSALLLANDYDIDSSGIITLDGVVAASESRCTAVWNSGPDTITVTPDTFYVPGVATFQYQIKDDTDRVATATVSINMEDSSDNAAPVAVLDDSINHNEDTAFTSFATLLANDSDADPYDVIVVHELFAGTNGAIVGDQPGAFMPPPNFLGVATFTYTVRDLSGAISAPAAVTLTVVNVNDLPVGVDDDLTATEDTPRTIMAAELLDNDIDPDLGNPVPDVLSIRYVTNAVNCSVSLDSGNVLFTPATNFSGEATFKYQTEDQTGQYQVGVNTVRVDVEAVADTPTLTTQDAIIFEGHGAIGLAIDAALVDDDGSELLQIFIANVPANMPPSNGTEFVPGTWAFSPQELADMFFIPAPGTAGTNATLDVTAWATEMSNYDTAPSSTETLQLTVLKGIDIALLSEPDNGDGFAITGGSTPTGDMTGFSVAIVGDQNGDGIDDFMVGAPQAAPEGLYQRGKAYLVYGGPGSQPLDLSAISGDSALGFELLGEYGDAGGPGSPSFDEFDIHQSWHTYVGPRGDGFGFGVARAGDVNGDGTEDLFASGPTASGHRGKGYLLFGDATESSLVLAANLNDQVDSRGFQMLGERAYDYNGWADSKLYDGDRAGVCVDGLRDFNGDGLADMLISAPTANTTGASLIENAGRIYIVFGKTGHDTALLTDIVDEADPRGLAVTALTAANATVQREYGRWARDAGDFNGDGLSDFVFGGGFQGNLAHLIYGKRDVSNVQISGNIGEDLPAADGQTIRFHQEFTNGVLPWHMGDDVITGAHLGGSSVTGGGDINGDGFSDLVFVGAGANEAGLPGFFNQALVVLGNADGGTILSQDVVNGTAGFEIKSNVSWDIWRQEASILGDVNGDGLDDIILGVSEASPRDNAQGGKVYVVYGKIDTNVVNLSDLEAGIGGYVIFGEDSEANLGFSVNSGGDLNGDGLADIVLGAPFADVDSTVDAGKAYVIYGGAVMSAVTHSGTSGNDTLTGDAGANYFAAGLGDDTMTGNGGLDAFYGGPGGDTFVVPDVDFQRVHGGTGIDTLSFGGDGTTITLGDFGARLDSIEHIDLGVTGTQTLVLRALDVLNLSPDSNELIVTGPATGLVRSLNEPWAYEGPVTVSSLNFTKFTSGLAVLLVQDTLGTEMSPMVSSEAVVLNEVTTCDPASTQTGDIVGTLPAIDPDGGTLTDYAILSGNPVDGSLNPTFIIDSVTGQITVGLNLAVLDFETTPQIVMQVSATDSDGYSGTGDLTIALADLNDPVTVVTAGVPGSFSVDEHSPSSTVLYDFEADDVDANDVHTWTLYERDVSDNMDGFAIDSDDGELRIGNPARVDFEEDPDRTFGVRVTDQGGVSSETFVTVNLDDLPNIVIPGDITFLTTGRNIWADSQSGTFSTQSDSLSRTYVKGQDTISKDIGGSGVMPPMHIDLDIGGHVGFDAALDITSGNVGADLPYAVSLTFPDAISTGSPITVATSLTLGAAAAISGATPSMGCQIGLGITNLEADASMSAHIAGVPFDPEFDLFDFMWSGVQVERTWQSTAVPYSATRIDGDTVGMTAPVTTDLFTEEDWAALFASALEDSGAGGQDIGGIPTYFASSSFALDLSYTTFSATMGGAVLVDQQFTLDINNVTATMTLENGVTTFTWTVGDDLNITVPAGADVNGDGQVSYTIDYTLDSTFTNTTAFGVSMTVYIDIGQGTATVYSVSGGNLQELASIPFIMLADQDMTFTGFAESIPFVFPLGGFNTPTTTGFFDLINP